MIDWLLNLFNWKKNPKMDTVSFLIGSGFSKADGLPLVGEINERMRRINEDEIIIHSEGTAFFLNGQTNENEWSRKAERLFVQEFLKFYSNEVIDGEGNFHYEDFYDYYSEYLRTEDNEYIDEFCETFRNENDNEYNPIADNYNLVSQFHNTFNQLLSNFLQRAKYYENVSHLNYFKYDDFIGFLNHLIEKNQVKVHTLNHDLLFERVASVPPLWQEFSDGYEELGSPYYSEVNVNQTINKRYRVRLKYFQNRFDKKICLYKLHGSIDTYQFNIADQHRDLTRVKSDYGVEPRFVKEVQDETGRFSYIKGWQNNYPDFLSGTSTKVLSYGNEYYELLFKHFAENLKKSKLLIVIGYGFGDSGINDYLKKYFLDRGGKMVVIIPKKPDTELINYPNTVILEKKMEQVSLQEYMSLLN